MAGVVRWNKLPGCWQLKDKKNSFNYLQLVIKTQWCNNIYIYIYIYICIYIYIYIYMYMYILLLFVVFERQINEVSD